MIQGTLSGVPTKEGTRAVRTFWWDREARTGADDLRAVIFDADSALAHVECDDARNDLIDAVMSLFVAGIWVGVVSTRPRSEVEALVRQLLGDGVVETIVTIDDLHKPESARCGELYRLALWEMGITPRAALAITGPGAGWCATALAGVPAVIVDEPLTAAGCQQAHRRWWIRQTV